MKQTRLINNIVGGSYEADARIAGCAVSQNLYAESVEEASNGFYFTSSLRSVEGERVIVQNMSFEDPFNQGCRGMFVASDDSIFAAFGSSVMRITKNSITGVYSAKTIYNEGNPTVGKVRFAETGGVNSHVCWVDGTEHIKAYPIDPLKAEALGVSVPILFRTPLRVYLTSDEIKKDENFHVSPTQICSVKGSLVINDPETDTWYYTESYILGGTTYKRSVYDLDENGNVKYEEGTYKVATKEVKLNEEEPSSSTCYLWLDRYSKPRFQTAEYSADKVTGMVVCGDMMFVIGAKSIQIYTQESSTDAQGFSSMIFNSSGRNIKDLGAKVSDTIVELDGNVIFLGSSARGERSIFAMNGNAPIRISTNVIERELQGADVSTSYALGWVQNGHSFYCLSVPSLKKTYVYDFATRQWHNRSTRNPDGTDSYWWAQYASNANGDIVLGSGGIGILARLDKDKYDDYRGEPIIKRRTSPIYVSDYSPFMVNDVMLLWNTGTTNDINNDGNAKNPVVMLEVSTDGGNTFGDERWAYGGQVGDYGHRSIWYGIGCGNMFVFRFTISDMVNVVITGAKISHTKLNRF